MTCSGELYRLTFNLLTCSTCLRLDFGFGENLQ